MSETRTSLGHGVCTIALSLAVAAVAHAHEPPSGLLAHFTFDGALADATGNGFTAEMVGADISDPPSPQFVEGRFGQAIAFDGERSVRIPLDLYYDRYPAVTITGWLYLQNEDSRGALVGTGSGDGPQIRVNADDIFASHANGRNRANGALRPGRWFFFVGSWDYRSGTNRLSWRARSQTEPFETAELDPPAQDLWLGSIAELQSAAEALAIDEVRVYDRVLTEEELEGLRLLGPGKELVSATEEPESDPADADSADELLGIPTAVPVGGGASTGGDRTSEATGEDSEMAAEAAAQEEEYEALVVESTVDGFVQLPSESEDDAADDSAESGADEPDEASPTGYGYRLDEVVASSFLSGSSGDYSQQVFVSEAIGNGASWGRSLLSGFSFAEDNDKPCYVRIRSWDRRNAGLDEQAFDGCGGDFSLVPTLFRPFSSRVDYGEAQAVVSATVCQRASNQRIKGLRLQGKRVISPAALSPNDLPPMEDELANCNDWQFTAECPSGTVAVGARLYFSDGTRLAPADYWTGLRLLCAPLRPL